MLHLNHASVTAGVLVVFQTAEEEYHEGGPFSEAVIPASLTTATKQGNK